MSSDLTVARRYAQALYAEADQQGKVEEVDKDIDLIKESLQNSRELVLLFESPIVPREKKFDIITQLFEQRVEDLTIRFMGLLIEKERESVFPTVVQAYRKQRDQHLGITEASVKVATTLNPEEERRLIDALENITGKHVRLRVSQDPELIGGIIVRIGDTVYDGSVRHQLVALREQLEQRSFVTNGS